MKAFILGIKLLSQATSCPVKNKGFVFIIIIIIIIIIIM